MKVITSKEMARIEALAFSEGSSDKEFMACAGKGIATALEQEISLHQHEKNITLLCGKGNNAGDAYVTATLLIRKGYRICSLQLFPIEQCSPLCQYNAKLFSQSGGKILEIAPNERLPLPHSGVFLDGILGTGFHGRIQKQLFTTIEEVNQSPFPVISIDIPSGLNGNTGEVKDIAIKANMTIFLGLPKTGFFIENAWNYVGRLHHVDFGLDQSYIKQAKEDFIKIPFSTVSSLLPPLIRNRHKYQAGYVIGFASSPGMSGAAMLSCYAAIRSGAGIVRLLHPQGMEAEFSNNNYELIKQPYLPQEGEKLVEILNAATASFIGPGIGTSPNTQKIVQQIFSKIQKPCVIDADALNILALNKASPPPKSLLTPHLGEMHRLLGLTKKHPLNMDFIHLCSQYAKKNHITLVVKGAPTFIFHLDETPLVNPWGDPGMATAGSGDVLTGILTALLAQKLSPKDAAILGTSLHAIAGERAAEKLSSYSLTASDLIETLPFIFKQFSQTVKKK